MALVFVQFILFNFINKMCFLISIFLCFAFGTELYRDRGFSLVLVPNTEILVQ